MPLTLPTGDVLAANLYAVPLVWGWAILAGLPLAGLLRVPLGPAAVPLLGLAVWSAALYLLPFPGGHDWTLGVVAVAGGGTLVLRRWAVLASLRRLFGSPSAWLLGVLFVVLHTGQVCDRVPFGMDATMHTTSGRLIAEHHGLPRTHAPFAADLPFPAVNLGLPALAAAAVRCGATPPAATLATVPFAFFTFALALHLLARRWVPRFGAASLAVAGLLASRGLQLTVSWGGFPTVAGFAVGLLAARVLLDLVRRPSPGSGAVAGLLVAAIPLVHGISGAVWVYVIGPPMLLAMGFRLRRRGWRQVAVGVTVAGVVTAAVVGAYLMFSNTHLTEQGREWTREYQTGFAPKGEGVELLRNAASGTIRAAGEEPSAAWLVGTAWLLVRGRWREGGLLLLAAGLLFVVVLNSTTWILPGSIALYPERAPYLLNALAVVALAIGWRALPHWSRRLKVAWAVVGGVLVLTGVPSHWRQYQRAVTLPALPPEQRAAESSPVVGDHEMAALVWCRDHLDPARDVVESEYETAGAYLPAVAGIASTGWHVHCFILPDQAEFFTAHPPTHWFVLLANGEPPPGSGEEVFRNPAVVVLRLPSR